MMKNLKEVIGLFFKLGIVAFGGPAAHIAMIHKEVVDKRKWMDEQHFLDLIGATALIPGPNSTEMVLHCSKERAGISGLIFGGLSFLIPACVLTGLLAYFYVEFQTLPNFEDYIVGIKPIVLILIVDAIRKLHKKAIKRAELYFVAFTVLGLNLWGVSEVVCLLIGAFLAYGISVSKSKLTSVEPISIFLVFLKVGSILFGSGYVLIAYLQEEVVARGWISTTQLADAIAFGQFTPGPVLSTSTFVGYLVNGVPGAVLATVGIFLPSFLFVILLNPLIPKMRNSKMISSLLDGLNAGSLGLMAAVLLPLSQVTFTNVSSVSTFGAMLLLYIFFQKKLSSVSLVSISLVLGYGLSQIL
jgi:chromate transporter